MSATPSCCTAISLTIIATGNFTFTDISLGRLPAGMERRRLEEEGVSEDLPKGHGRNVSVISLNHECNIIRNHNAAIPAQYFKSCLVFMLPCRSYNINSSTEGVKVSNSGRSASRREKITNIHIQTWRCHIGKCYGAAPSARAIVFPGQACLPPSVTLVLPYYFLWCSLVLSLMLLFFSSPPSPNAICQ